LVVVGDARNGGHDLGQTYLTPFGTFRQRCTVLDRGEAEADVADQATPLYLLNADQTMRKVEIHELAHQWDVNPTGVGGHCTSLAYDSTLGYPASGAPAP